MNQITAYEGLPPRSVPLPVPALSFEFSPPKNEALEAQLWTCIRRLEPLAPRFVSVTYGAGGSTQARTHATVARIVQETSLVPAAHLTCVGASRGEVDDVARQYWDAGVRRIRMVTPMRRIWSPGCGGWRISRSRWRPIRRRTPRR